MTIERFSKLPLRNEDTILDECGFPEAQPIKDMLPFYPVKGNTVFLFLDDEDIDWIVKPDAFSHKVYDSLMNKALVCDEVYHKKIVLFVNEGKYPNYVFYGVYELLNPYVTVGSNNNVVEAHTPLKFNLLHPNFTI